MLSADEKARIGMGILGFFALGYGVDAFRKGVFVMAMRNVAGTVEIPRTSAPIRYWTYVSLFVVLGAVLLWCAWYGVPV